MAALQLGDWVSGLKSFGAQDTFCDPVLRLLRVVGLFAGLFVTLFHGENTLMSWELAQHYPQDSNKDFKRVKYGIWIGILTEQAQRRVTDLIYTTCSLTCSKEAPK